MVDPPPLIRPVPGPVRAAFRYDRATPFAARQRRGTTFAARPGTAVAAPCRGRVTFAGRTPRGTAVTVRCGAWTSTVLGVAPTVRTGTSVAAGRTVGRASDRAVALSLRPVADRWGYVDPRPSSAEPRTGTPLGRAPRTRRTPTPTGGRAPRPRPVVAPAARRRPVAVPVATGPAVAVAVEVDGPRPVVPWAVPIGSALAVLGLAARRRRRRPGPRSAGRARSATAHPPTRLWTDVRAPVPSIRNGLLRHHPDLLRQRRSTPRARVLDDRR